MRANHIWWNYKKAHEQGGGILSRERVYHGKPGMTLYLKIKIDLEEDLDVELEKEVSSQWNKLAPVITINGSTRPEHLGEIDKLNKAAEAIDAISEIIVGKASKWLEVIDDLTTDQWGGAGPDCSIVPALCWQGY